MISSGVRYPTPESRIMDRVEYDPFAGCWLWNGSVSSSGYGHLKVSQKTLLAHRHSYEIFNGEIPDRTDVRHKCDVKLCVNPNHLLIGTRAQNMQDAVLRNRLIPVSQRERIPQHLVLAVISLRGARIRSIAKVLNMAPVTVRQIMKREGYL